MQNKLQELTDRLYEEGLSKGRAEGERLLEEARAKAAEIVKDAEAQAEALVEKARREAQDIRSKADSDLKMAASQCLQATKKDIENLLVAGICDTQDLRDPGFLRKIILAVAEKFSAEESADLALVLPESLRDELTPFVSGALAEALKGEVKASFSKKISGGFTIGPRDGSYFISLTEDTFKELIGGYIRPVTRKILFGE